MKLKYILFLFSFVFCAPFINSQVIYEEIESKKLGESRKIKIQLPRNYDRNTDKSYPIILVFDAEYLFEPVAGNVDYYSYWEEMPEAIVVGIMHGDTRNTDGAYDDINHMPYDRSALFFEFIGLELMPYIDKKYRTAKFILAVGHEYTANFINYYLFKDPPLFNGFLALSPDLAPMLETRIPQRIATLNQKTFYYLATASHDIKPLREISLELHNGMQAIDKPNIHYYFDDFEGASHYSLVGKAIPSALEKIFAIYRPFTKKDYDDYIIPLQTPVYDFLIEKYSTIENLFGFKTKVRENDIIAIATAAERKEEWDSLEKVAKLAQKEHPGKNLGSYYLARYYEGIGDFRKAIKTYQAAYVLEEVGFITTDMLLERAEMIKRETGN